MNYFNYQNNELYCEEVKIRDIAREVGSPFYLYSYRTLVRHYRVFEEAFQAIKHLVCYSFKVNSNLTLCQILAKEGAGADIVSGGELFKALKVGISPKKIVFGGVGKTRAEIEYALENDILMFNVESLPELYLIEEIAGSLRKRAPVALRVNPDIDAQTHPYISTGLKENKFGIDISQIFKVYKLAQNLNNVEIVGIDVHIGSQITKLAVFKECAEKIAAIVDDLKKEGIKIKYIDMGGGLGITYRDEKPPSPKDYASAIIPLLKKTGCELILEPGRVMVGNAGILVIKVLYFKENFNKKFIIVDAGMNDIIRPSLYNAYHMIVPLKKPSTSQISLVDIVGPICESTDFFAKNREFPPVKSGDLLAILSAGAYGFVASSNYNARLRVPEILVKGDRHYLIRKRETNEDLIKGEEVPGV